VAEQDACALGQAQRGDTTAAARTERSRWVAVASFWLVTIVVVIAVVVAAPAIVDAAVAIPVMPGRAAARLPGLCEERPGAHEAAGERDDQR